MRTVITAQLFKRQLSVPLADITHFIASDKYVTAYYSGGELILSETLNALEVEFASCMIRVHRGTLVKTELMRWMEQGECSHTAYLKLEGVEQLIRVSRRNLTNVRRIMATRLVNAPA